VAAGLSALDRWREQLEGWTIPEEILAQAPEDPWVFPAELFASKADATAADTPSRLRAVEALPESGSVLDVGCGAGAASLALVPPAGRLIGVDPLPQMLAEFGQRARRAEVSYRAVEGEWPEAAPGVESADVVVCHHVLYNVRDLKEFVSQLTAKARRRVVVELTDEHPVAWTGYLWRRFHEVERPEGPTAHDCAAALEELGIHPAMEVFDEPGGAWGFRRKKDAVALVRRRLCLPASRDPEVEEAIGKRLVEREGFWRVGAARRLATLWWDA
jgi:SAM-dependent methyltransferase